MTVTNANLVISDKPTEACNPHYTIFLLAPRGTFFDKVLNGILEKDTAIEAELESIIFVLSEVIPRWTALDEYFNQLLKVDFLNMEQYSKLLFDDEKFTRSRKYFWTIGCLTEFDNVLSDNIRQWELYYKARLQPLLDDSHIANRFDAACPHPPLISAISRGDAMLTVFKNTIEKAQGHINNLNELRDKFRRKLEVAKALRDGVSVSPSTRPLGLFHLVYYTGFDQANSFSMPVLWWRAGLQQG